MDIIRALFSIFKKEAGEAPSLTFLVALLYMSPTFLDDATILSPTFNAFYAF